ncbi:type II toxin-antitoxin system RelE/ParE family toxin [Pelosinus propionicus]|uniref:Phage-related protein n=1 Tax=Pelosinus propionicus DSM 13327 TaxID=1123291 RepID=A0A1I4PU02_9FIRM|nr:type II toxin-antitoxin system RelE/ParE family toxin [Pelosinus propionicus]SFM31036.1 Phage-related protein [Pelosinus propionicus DSM 13327]
MKWEIELYTKANNENPVLDFIESLPAKHRAKVYREIDLLEEFGIDLDYPHTCDLKGSKNKGLWELRIKFSSNISRIFYFLPEGNKFVLIHGFVKKSNETPEREIEIARRRKKDYVNRNLKGGDSRELERS